MLVANLATERDDALVALAGAALVGHGHDDLESIAVFDWLVDAPIVNPEHGHDRAIVDSGLAGQPAGDGQHQWPVRDRLAVGLLLAELPIHVRRVEITGKAREVDDVGRSHRAPRRVIGLADLEILEIEPTRLSL